MTDLPTQHRSEFKIRDPFVVPHHASQTYYMYSSFRFDDRPGVGVYTSKDLENWKGPKQVLKIPDNFWAGDMVWAPEVHGYKNKYYLFVTLTSTEELPTPIKRPANLKRGTQIFVSDSLEGPFEAFANQPHTPIDWMCLDGTLWQEDGIPYMIFCHEWHQIVDGSMDLVELKEDLSGVVGDPEILFYATDGGWVKSLKEVGTKQREIGKHGFVTDGPFLFRTKEDRLIMIWSSFGEHRYAVAQAYSETGSVKGPWIQANELLFHQDGGHGMIFTTFDGKLMLSLHQPNVSDERAHFFELEDLGDRLELK